MLIDFHAHAFPDNLAPNIIPRLAKKAGGIATYTNGGITDTAAKMQGWGVDRFVLLNIATNVKQQTNVNNFAIAQNTDNVISFGSVHPDSPGALDELERIAGAGLLGVKFHPEYQDFRIDDKKVYPLYEKCRSLGLVMVFHAGSDLGFSRPPAAPPAAVGKVLRAFPDAKMVMAHLGGCLLWDEVESHVAGCAGYIDTSFTFGRISAEQATRIIKKHGADRVLFGSDCPWESPADTFAFIDSLKLTDDEKDKIFSKNALELLGI